LADIIAQCLMRDPDARPNNAADLAVQLRDAMREKGGRPSVDRMRDFVATHGGDTLASLHQNIRQSLALDLPPIGDLQLGASDSWDLVIDSFPVSEGEDQTDQLTRVDAQGTTANSPLLPVLPDRTVVDHQSMKAFREYAQRKATLESLVSGDSGVVSRESLRGDLHPPRGRHGWMKLTALLVAALVGGYVVSTLVGGSETDEQGVQIEATPTVEPGDEPAARVGVVPHEVPEQGAIEEIAPSTDNTPQKVPATRANRPRRRPPASASMTGATTMATPARSASRPVDRPIEQPAMRPTSRSIGLLPSRDTRDEFLGM
jgi:hypothetical protein